MSTLVNLIKGRVGLTESASEEIERILVQVFEGVIRDEIRPLKELLLGVNVQTQELKQTTEELKLAINEAKTTEFSGKRKEALPEALESAAKMNGEEIRKLIHRAAGKYLGGKRAGLNHLYTRVATISRVNIFEIGQTRLGKKDGVDGWRKDPSYINTILREGLGKYAVIVAQDMMSGK